MSYSRGLLSHMAISSSIATRKKLAPIDENTPLQDNAAKHCSAHVNQFIIRNHTETVFPYVEIVAVKDNETQVIIKSAIEPHIPYGAGMISKEAYQLQFLVSKTSDCSVSIFATDPYLIRGAYRNEMIEKILTYHREIHEILKVSQICHNLASIGYNTLPQSLPSSLLQELKKLEEDCENHTQDESIKKFQKKHRTEIMEKKDTFQLMTEKTHIIGKVSLDIYTSHMEITFNENTQVVQFQEK